MCCTMCQSADGVAAGGNWVQQGSKAARQQHATISSLLLLLLGRCIFFAKIV